MELQLPRSDYRIIYADPPWSFATWSHRGQGKGASQHYTTMTLNDICALPVSQFVADDAALFLWVVQPMLPEALDVLNAWGFKFRTVAFVWVKMPMNWHPDQLSFFQTGIRLDPRLGLGYHTRSGAEQCWLAVRGNGKGYERAEQGIEQVLHAPLREHSRKPNEIAERIVRLTGDVPRAELFARETRPGWDCRGLERNQFDEG